MTFYKNINPNYCLNDFSLTRRLNMNIMDQHVQTKHILIWTSERWVSSVTQEDLWKNITIKHKTFFCHTVTAVAPFLFYFIFIFSQQSFITILELLLLWKGKTFFFTTRSLHNEIIIKKERRKNKNLSTEKRLNELCIIFLWGKCGT